MPLAEQWARHNPHALRSPREPPRSPTLSSKVLHTPSGGHGGRRDGRGGAWGATALRIVGGRDTHLRKAGRVTQCPSLHRPGR